MAATPDGDDYSDEAKDFYENFSSNFQTLKKYYKARAREICHPQYLKLLQCQIKGGFTPCQMEDKEFNDCMKANMLEFHAILENVRSYRNKVKKREKEKEEKKEGMDDT